MRSFDETDAARAPRAPLRRPGLGTDLHGSRGSEEAERLARRDFGALPAGERVLAVPPCHDQSQPRLLVVPNQSSQTDLRVCFRAPGECSPERPALDLLMRIVDDGMSTRLYHRICDDQGLCYDVSAGYDGYEDDGVVDFAAGVQHKRVERVTREILTLMTELAARGPTEDEVRKAKQRHAWDLEAMLDSPEDVGSFLGTGALFTTVETPEARLQALQSVSRDAVQEVTRTLVAPERLNVVAVGLLDPREERRLEETVMGFRPAPG